MRQILLLFLLLPFAAISQVDICSGEHDLCVVQFSAPFNKSNEISWLDQLSDVDTKTVDIMLNTELQAKYKIAVVPTIIVFDNGEEATRFQANIMMSMETTKEEVQESIDEIIMSKF